MPCLCFFHRPHWPRACLKVNEGIGTDLVEDPESDAHVAKLQSRMATCGSAGPLHSRGAPILASARISAEADL